MIRTGACNQSDTTQWYYMVKPQLLFCQEKILEFEIGNIMADCPLWYKREKNKKIKQPKR